MQQWRVNRCSRARAFKKGLLCAAAGLASAAPGPVLAGYHSVGGQPATGPRQLVARYFADLAGRQYYAAHLLEAPCSHTVQLSNGPGAPPGLAAFHGRTRWVSGSARLEGHYIHTIRVTGIAPFHLPLLTAGHMQGLRLYGYFSFARPTSPAGNPNEPTALTRLVVFAWQCSGRWWVDPGWIFSSRQYGSR
jgi:hypothetical protein